MKAIEVTETRGAKNCEHARGLSGEIGCLQYMPATFRAQSIRVLGYAAEMKRSTVEYVAAVTLQDRLDRGYTEAQLALEWNAGGAQKCSKGVNGLGVPYDSCSYVESVLSNLRKQ